jgi:SAM-dependent methyltransferase
MNPEPVWCRRYLEDVSVTGDRAVVTGWVFGRDVGSLRRMDVATRPSDKFRIDSFEVADSTDVTAAFPEARPADRCRFRLVLSVQDAAILSPFVVMLKPVFDGGVGRTWSVGHGLPSPPNEFIARVGGGTDVGLEFLDYFVDFGNLLADDVVLDLGCGTGRMAIPLQRFLAGNGRYIGVDVDAQLIDWCKENIQAQDRRFEFVHLPARNNLYNPDGRVETTEVALPILESSISFAFATSVLTHLRAAHAAHYLRELGRVLRPNGRLLITAFLMDAASLDAVQTSTADLVFRALDSEMWTTDVALPEKAVGFRRETLNRWAAAGGLAPATQLRGTWAAGRDGYSYQDILVFRKP